MAIIQISKIQVRRGPAIDLPGQPTQLSPLQFEPGLDVGELAFTSDQGRLFIGHDPREGNANFKRASFPYQNVEVLTENSTEFIEAILNRMNREMDSNAFHNAILPINLGDWAPVVVARDGDADYEYRLTPAGQVSATIEYSAFDTEGAAVRIGTLTVRHLVGATEPHVVDNAFALRRLDVVDPDGFSADELYNAVEFRFVEAGPVGARYIVLEYRNRSTTQLSLQFRTTNTKSL